MDMRMEQSTALYHRGIRGLVIGAVIGALVALVGTAIMDFTIHIGTGGPALGALGGATFGGLLGLIGGLLIHRRSGRGAQG